MQPVTITNLDRVLTALVQARQRGELSPNQVVLDVRPHEPGSAHVFTVRDDAGSGLMSPYPITTPVKYAAAATTSNWWMGGNHKELEVGTRRIDCEACRLFAFVSAIVGSSSSRVDRSFVKHLGLNWSRCFYYAAALLLLALNQTRSRNIRLMKLFQFV